MKERNTHLGFQFCVAVYVKVKYDLEGEAAGNIYSDWGGIECPNNWKGCVDHARKIVAKNPGYLCIVTDRLNRKKPILIDITGEKATS